MDCASGCADGGCEWDVSTANRTTSQIRVPRGLSLPSDAALLVAVVAKPPSHRPMPQVHHGARVVPGAVQHRSPRVPTQTVLRSTSTLTAPFTPARSLLKCCDRLSVATTPRTSATNCGLSRLPVSSLASPKPCDATRGRRYRSSNGQLIASFTHTHIPPLAAGAGRPVPEALAVCAH